MDYQTLQDLYLHQLKDLYSAEKQIIRALPKMIRHATAPKLKEGLEKHLAESRTHVERLESIFDQMGKSTRGSKCRAIEGIIEEGEAWLKEDACAEIMDAGIICAAQRVEHYEIAGYGCARAFAAMLGEKQAEGLLDKTLQEEGKADQKLTTISEKVNAKACAAGEKQLAARSR